MNSRLIKFTLELQNSKKERKYLYFDNIFSRIFLSLFGKYETVAVKNNFQKI